MNKILIFYGSCSEFQTYLPLKGRNLTDLVMEMDSDNKKTFLYVKGLPDSNDDEVEESKIKVENFIINSDEYCGVREHVIINFANFIARIEIDNMYIQNPPLHLSEQLYRAYGDKKIIEEVRQEYNGLTEDILKLFYNDYDKRIIGQEKVKNHLLKTIYPVLNNKQKKPVVLMFYGSSGVGKTETAQYLSEVLAGKLFRKQFSMYQNNQFATYLFGGSYNEKSFAKDLLDRESNVILLDEFDKANQTFHSAFYQLFDEGIFEDQNYRVHLDSAIIICTSNYISEEEIKKNLGDAIFNRFDAIIHFENLSNEAKKEIADVYINEVSSDYDTRGIKLSEDVLERLRKGTLYCNNAREVKRLIKDAYSLMAIRKICN